MKTLLLLPLILLVSCTSYQPAAVSAEGQVLSKGHFDRFANNGRDSENMRHSFELLEQIQAEDGQGQVIFWETGGREYFHAMRKISQGVHQGPNPSLGYYTSRREVVNVTGSTIPWEKVLAIRANL